MKLLGALETRFINENRGSAAEEHAKVLAKTQELLTSEQMKAFQVRSEPKDMIEKYGDNNFGRGCLMARRLVEVGVPFVEVNSGGWDLHQGCFTSLEKKLPELDKAFRALMEDLKQRGLLDSTVVIVHGRVWPHAADQRQRGPRSLRAGVERGARRRGDRRAAARSARRTRTARRSRPSRIRRRI